MRGSQSLFADIFVKESHPQPRLRKGRSRELIARRNECLITRYYFYAKFKEKRYDKILEALSAEFFLSDYTIPEIITANYAQLKGLHKEQPPISVFAKKWPHMVWA